MHKTLLLGVVVCLVLSIHSLAEISPPIPSGTADNSSPRAQEQTAHGLTAHDLTLFRGDLTPEAGMACAHLGGTPAGHIPPTIGLTISDVFVEPHDCGGFHGNWMLAAEVLNETPPIELLRWGAKRSLPYAVTGR